MAARYKAALKGSYIKWVGLLLLVVFLFSFARKAFDSIFDAFKDLFKSDEEKAQDQVTKNVTQTLDTLPAKEGLRLTKQDFYYRDLADQLESFMAETGQKGWPPAFQKLETLTRDELIYLVHVFNIRFNPGTWGLGDFKGSLFTWFEKEYSGFFDSGTKEKLKAIFAKTGLWD